MPETITIARLGAKADGIADTEDASLYVPYALPGERVVVERDGRRAEIVERLTTSPERVEPFCPYFGECGGCATQHIREDYYRDWKRGTVEHAVRQARLPATTEPLIDAHGEGRRRLTLHIRFPERMQVGYMAARSHRIVEIDHCPVAHPALRDTAPTLARAIGEHLRSSRKPLDVQITHSEAGFDVDIRGHGPVEGRRRLGLVTLAADLDLARLSVHGDVIVERRPPSSTVGRARVVPPAGSFMQATRSGEEALAGLVVDACAGSRRVADLFSGWGPFALRLAERVEVHAVEMEAKSLAALDKAARAVPGLRRVSVEARDLFRRPLLAPELAGFDAVVMDPPRAGAEAQARELGASKVPLVVSVSCDAATFVRDAAILAAAGFKIERVMLVDQFKYSPHVEIVGILRREPARKRRSLR